MKKIQVLGMGCPKCTKLAENAEAAAKEMGIEPGGYYGKMCESLGKLGYPV